MLRCCGITLLWHIFQICYKMELLTYYYEQTLVYLKLWRKRKAFATANTFLLLKTSMGFSFLHFIHLTVKKIHVLLTNSPGDINLKHELQNAAMQSISAVLGISAESKLLVNRHCWQMHLTWKQQWQCLFILIKICKSQPLQRESQSRQCQSLSGFFIVLVL